MEEHRTHYPATADGYEIEFTIGYGAFSQVFSAKVKSTGERVAVKSIDMEGQQSVFDDTRKEIGFLRSSNHPNIAPLFCSFVHDHSLWLVMEIMWGGSVFHIMKFAFPRGFDEHSICTILKETLKGVEYLHATGRMHRDIKAGNILIGEKGEVKLADFGLSASFLENGLRKDTRQTFAGTPCWMAPEVMEGVGYDQRADIWSFGITALEMAKGQAPYANFPAMKILRMIMENPPPKLDREKNDKGEHRFSKDFKDMIKCCLQKDPAKRPTAAKLLDHKFFKKSKKPDYLVSHLLQKLPPLHERAKRMQKKLANPEEGDTQQEDPDGGWVFDSSNSSNSLDSVTPPTPKLSSASNPPADVVPAISATNSSPAITPAPTPTPVPAPTPAPVVPTSTVSSPTLPSIGGGKETPKVTQHGRFTVTETKPTVTEKKGRFVVSTTVH